MIKLNSAIPLYQQVAEDLKNRIEQGEFCSGQSIPSEAKLCEQYEVSRITIRNAIAELVEQEILVKYQGKGVFVRTPKISSSLTTFKGFTYFCQENHIKTYTKILENKVSNLISTASKVSKEKKPAASMFDVFDAQQELSDLEEVTLLKLIVDDITPEAMVKVMKENDEKIAMVTAEGGVFGMLAGRYSTQPNMDIFLKAYAGEPYCSDRMGRTGEALDHPLLSLLLMVQPKVLQDALENRDFRERGLMARFLYSLPPSRVGSRVYDSKPIPKELRTAYNQLIKDLLSIGENREWQQENTLIHLSDEAYQISKEFFNEIEQKMAEDYEEIEDWAGKYHGQTMRIAGLLHVVKYRLGAANVILEGQTMKEAIQIGRYFLECAMAAFRLSGIAEPQEEKDAKYLMKKIDSFYASQNPENDLYSNEGPKIPKIPNMMRLQDLWQACRGKFENREDMQLVLDILIERGFIRIIKKQNKKAGRPPEFIEVNPEYWKSKEMIDFS